MLWGVAWSYIAILRYSVRVTLKCALSQTCQSHRIVRMADTKMQSLAKKNLPPRMDVRNRALCYTLRHPPKGQRKMSDVAHSCV